MSGEGSVHHPLNTSSSKHRFSFAKADRFLPPVHPVCDKYYDVRACGKPRTTSFGIGDRLAKQPLRQAPSPDHYHILTEFEQAVQQKRKGFSFGCGRQMIGGPLQAVRLHKEMPGPGTYPTPSTLKSCNITLKPRLPDRSLADISIPGPGMYALPPVISKTGRYASSKSHRITKDMLRSRQCCHQDLVNVTATITTDDTRQQLNPEGRYFSSKFESSKVRSFSKGHRATFEAKKGDILGPGSYKQFSPFDN